MRYLIGFVVGAMLWRIGGWKLKWTRRYILPFALIMPLEFKNRKWKQLIALPLLVAAFSLGYGENSNYWKRFCVGWAWVLPKLIFFGFNWLAIILPFLWILLYRLSNWKKSSSIFKWSTVEIITGGWIGMTYA